MAFRRYIMFSATPDTNGRLGSRRGAQTKGDLNHERSPGLHNHARCDGSDSQSGLVIVGAACHFVAVLEGVVLVPG